MPFFIIFMIIPFVELAVFASVSGHIGIWTTLCLAFLTAILGGALVKHQGLQTIVDMRKALDRGQMPLDALFDGFCLIAAGALLITPGFVTDTVGFLLLIPRIRALLRQYIQTHTTWAASATDTSYHSEDLRSPRMRDSGIIEGEYERVDEP